MILEFIDGSLISSIPIFKQTIKTIIARKTLICSPLNLDVYFEHFKAKLFVKCTLPLSRVMRYYRYRQIPTTKRGQKVVVLADISDSLQFQLSACPDKTNQILRNLGYQTQDFSYVFSVRLIQKGHLLDSDFLFFGSIYI